METNKELRAAFKEWYSANKENLSCYSECIAFAAWQAAIAAQGGIGE